MIATMSHDIGKFLLSSMAILGWSQAAHLRASPADRWKL